MWAWAGVALAEGAPLAPAIPAAASVAPSSTAGAPAATGTPAAATGAPAPAPVFAPNVPPIPGGPFSSGPAAPALNPDDDPNGPIAEVVIQAPEPRYVAPTRRDRIGRIWAPVYINNKGPFRLVLDTGSSHAAVNSAVAAALGIPLTDKNQVMLRGVTGSRIVPTITVDSFIIGDLQLRPARLPIVIDALGGADGVLGTDGMEDKRIYIDFRHDR